MMNAIEWWEIPSTNIKKTAYFYSKLFGWKMQPHEKDYIMFSMRGGIDGGIMKVKKTPGEGVMVYVTVKDVAATLEKAKKLGAKVVVPRTAMGEWGFWAAFKDPGGCSGVGLWGKK